MLSRINIKFGDPQKQGLQNPPIGKQAEIINADRFHFIESEETFNGKKAAAILSINYAAGRSEIRRPLIVAEGYDPGIITKPENVFGEGDIDDFIDQIDQILNSGLRDLLTVESSQEYDIIYVDWLNGVDDMRRNAKLLKTIIEWVNEQKINNGSSEENVVLGQSMGGLISRYALREMEIEGKDHETRLYVSHDAPHQGANVPYGLQYMARHARNEYVRAPLLMGTAEVLIPTILTGAAWFSQLQLQDFVTGFDDPPPSSYPSPYAVLTLADMPASRQLLQNFIKRDYTRDNTVHDNWQNELEALGYPQENGIKNVAISNGSECGVPQEFDPGDYLFRFYGKSSPGFFNGLIRIITDPMAGILLNNTDLLLTGILPGSSEYNYDIWAKTIPTGSNQHVYKGRIVYTKKLLFLFPIDVVVMNKNLFAPSGSLPIDTYPGGVYNVKSQIDLDVLPGFIGDRITHIENFNFIPVTSSLDIGEGALTLDEDDYLRAYSGGTPPLSPRHTPFDNFITAFNTNLNINPNQQHISFEERNADWLAAELNDDIGTIADCSFMCQPIVISGSATLCSSESYSVPVVGGNVQWSARPAGMVNISNNGSNNVIITPSNSFSNGIVTLTAAVNSQGCGSKIITKRIEVSTPAIYTLNSDGTKNYMGTSYSYPISYSTREITVHTDGLSTYSWDMFPGNIQWTAVNNKATFYINVPGNYLLTATAANDCGESMMFFSIDIGGINNYDIYPNPASSEINIEKTSVAQQSASIQTAVYTNAKIPVQLLDFNGVLVRTLEISAYETITQLDVSDLKEGLYFLIIGMGEEKETYKIIVAR